MEDIFSNVNKQVPSRAYEAIVFYEVHAESMQNWPDTFNHEVKGIAENGLNWGAVKNICMKESHHSARIRWEHNIPKFHFNLKRFREIVASHYGVTEQEMDHCLALFHQRNNKYKEQNVQFI